MHTHIIIAYTDIDHIRRMTQTCLSPPPNKHKIKTHWIWLSNFSATTEANKFSLRLFLRRKTHVEEWQFWNFIDEDIYDELNLSSLDEPKKKIKWSFHWLWTKFARSGIQVSTKIPSFWLKHKRKISFPIECEFWNNEDGATSISYWGGTIRCSPIFAISKLYGKPFRAVGENKRLSFKKGREFFGLEAILDIHFNSVWEGKKFCF